MILSKDEAQAILTKVLSFSTADECEATLSGTTATHATGEPVCPDDAAGRWQWSGAEGAVLVYRDDEGAQRFFPLEGQTSLTIGRRAGKLSRAHGPAVF